MKTKIKIFIVILLLTASFSNLKSQEIHTDKIQVEIKTEQSHFTFGNDIKIMFTVSNNSDKEFKFCFWQTPLEKEFTSNYFEILHESSTIQYNGKMIKRSAPGDDDYIVLQANESISEEISLAIGYLLLNKGKYTIKFVGSYLNDLPDSEQIEFFLE